jgi:hypothetical protein
VKTLPLGLEPHPEHLPPPSIVVANGTYQTRR